MKEENKGIYRRSQLRKTPKVIILASLITITTQLKSTITKYYEGLSTVHSISLLPQNQLKEKPTFIYTTSLTKRETNYTSFTTQVWVSSSSSAKVEIELLPPAKLACYHLADPNNDKRDQCLLAAALTVKGLEISSNQPKFTKNSYNYKESDKRYYDEGMISKYKESAVNGPLRPLENVEMRIDVVDKTSYFLAGISTDFGLFRFESGKNETYSALNLDQLMTKETSVESRFFKDIKVIQTTRWALISLFGWKDTALIDFVDMKIERKMENSGSGKFAIFNKEPSKGYFAKATSNSLKMMKYSDGSLVKEFTLFYFISAIEAIQESHLIFVGEDTILKVYNLDLDEPTVFYEYDTTEGIYELKFDIYSGHIIIGGSLIGQYISIDEPSLAECHPNCDGGCSKGFSPGHCTSCSATSELKNEICVFKTQENLSGGGLDYAKLEWSKPSEEAKVEEEKSLMDKAMGEYRNVVIIVGGLLIVICLCCCVKSCCGGDEGERRNNSVQDSREMMRQGEMQSVDKSKMFDESWDRGRSDKF